MFALPIYRMYTQNTTPCIVFSCCVGIGCPPPKLRSGIRVLPEMRYNHYGLIVSYDYQYLATWGGCNTYGKTGLDYNTNKPTTPIINWKGATPQNIVRVYSSGSWSSDRISYTIFRTESNDLYGTGSNANYFLNTTKSAILTGYSLITENVTDFCIAEDKHILYIKTDGRVYGLGRANFGFGVGNSPIDLKVADSTGTLINYISADNAKRVYCTAPENLAKSFVLKKDGTVLASGYNTDGCLGVNKTDSIIKSWEYVKKSDDNGVTFSNLTGVIDVITSNYVVVGGANASASTWSGGGGSGHMTSYFLTSTGYVYTCGSNVFGQLGVGSTATNLTINYATSAIGLTAADRFYGAAGGTSILVTASAEGHKVYTWGNNQFGQLGHGDQVNKVRPTEVTTLFGTKIRTAHGGGLSTIVNPAFIVVTQQGEIYGAGFNQTYALGITNAGVPNAGPITTFTKNEYFGPNPTQNQDPERYPLILNGDLVAGSNVISNATMSQNKTVLGTLETVYVLEGMAVFGDGITVGTTVTGRDFLNFNILLDKPATKNKTAAEFRFEKRIYAQNADLCGYGTEMAQKVITDDGTLYMSGWNQSLGNIGSLANPCFNFNYYLGIENVQVPTAFDAKKFK
jgi:hypothetical protein